MTTALRFVPLTIVGAEAIAECIRNDGPSATLTTSDGRVYEGNVVLEPTQQED